MSAGYGAGLRAGQDWAASTPPYADVNGFPACENVQEIGFDSDDYAAGYGHGVWSTWCREHRGCLATHGCRAAIRERGKLIHRTLRAQGAVHVALDHGDVEPGRLCISCPSASALAAAISALDARPGDAQGARLILHDAMCMSSCSGAQADDHARRQAGTVAALRKWHRAERAA